MIRHVHHVAVSVADMPRSLAAYGDGLGLRVRYLWNDGKAAILATGPGVDDTVVELFERADAGDRPHEARLLHLCFAVDDVDAAHARALAHGFAERTAPFDAGHDNQADGAAAGDPATPGRFAPRLSFVTGPDGEVVEFFDDRSV